MPINRRTVIAALPFAATAATPAIASAPEPSLLAGLIERHQNALTMLNDASIAMDKADTRLLKDDPIYIAPFKQGWSMKMGEDKVRQELSQAVQKQRERCGSISAINPALGTQVLQELNECEVKALADIKRAFAELEAKYQVNATDNAWRIASDAEEQALLEVCSYHCHTQGEHKARAEYLSDWSVRQSLFDEHYKALLQSMAG